jgi:hypothetical protein
MAPTKSYMFCAATRPGVEKTRLTCYEIPYGARHGKDVITVVE